VTGNERRTEDARMLRVIIDAAESFDEERAESFESTCAAFVEMLARLDRGGRDLTDRQRAWVCGVYEQTTGVPVYENSWSAGKVPKGRDVPTPAVLQQLPKRPPGRSAP
jgi:hypothetical protein